MVVKSLMSQKSSPIRFSSAAGQPSASQQARSASMASCTSLRTLAGPVGRLWQASRTVSGQRCCAASSASFGERGPKDSKPSMTNTRHVEHRA